MSKLKSFLRSLHISFKSQSLENARLISEMKELKSRNDHLEAELIVLIQTQDDCKKAKHMEQQLNNKCAFLEKELEKERDTFKVWTDSGFKTQNALGNKNWKTCLGYETKGDEPKVFNEFTKPVKY